MSEEPIYAVIETRVFGAGGPETVFIPQQSVRASPDRNPELRPIGGQFKSLEEAKHYLRCFIKRLNEQPELPKIHPYP